MTETEYVNMVNDFCFHVIWASKKILRGELWSAKMCLDAYLKNYLLKMIEMYSVYIHDVDVWHDGRFLDRWADDKIKEALTKCFAHYDREDMISALLETNKLFSQLAKDVAEIRNFNYPENAVDYLFKVEVINARGYTVRSVTVCNVIQHRNMNLWRSFK